MSRERTSTVVPLSRFRAALDRPRGAKRLDELISADKPAEAVAALSVPDLFFLIEEVGLADCTELVALATPAQVRGCVDMAVWSKDRLDHEAVKPWLTILIEAGYTTLGRAWEALDPELAALVLTRWVRVYDKSLEEEPPEDTDNPLIETPDTFFVLEVTAEREDDIRLVRRLVEDLYKADMGIARKTIMSARSEPIADLEEMSYRWRSGRMADLGFVDFYDALEVFRPLDAVEIGEGSTEPDVAVEEGDEARVARDLPAPYLEHLASKSFLVKALERVAAASEVDRLQTGLVYLINRVLAASQVEPGDGEAMALGSEQAAATLSLGLETASRGDLDRAVRALETVSLTRLHRLGFTVTLRLARLARSLAPRAVTATDADPILSALLAARPWFPRELDDPPEAGWRPFETADDIRQAATALTRLAVRVAIAEQALDVDLVALGRDRSEAPELDDHARTALLRLAAGLPPSPAPLSKDELEQTLGQAFAEGVLTDEARARGRADLDRLLARRLATVDVAAGQEHLGALVEGWLDDLDDALGDLSEGDLSDLDPRFVDRVLVTP